MGRVPSVGEVLPSQLASGAWLDNARNPFARDTLFEFLARQPLIRWRN